MHADFDGDGRHEVYIGSPNALLTGVVYVLYLHSDGSVVRAERLSEGNRGVGAIASFAGFGAAVADIGDVDHNGVRDLAVGAPFASSNAGEVFVLLLDRDGKVVNHTELASGSDGFGGSWGISRVSTGPGYLLGSSLAAAGDVDGDAVPDLLVGSPGRTSAGGALLCFLAGGSDGGGMAASVQTWSPTSVGTKTRQTEDGKRGGDKSCRTKNPCSGTVGVVDCNLRFSCLPTRSPSIRPGKSAGGRGPW